MATKCSIIFVHSQFGCCFRITRYILLYTLYNPSLKIQLQTLLLCLSVSNTDNGLVCWNSHLPLHIKQLKFYHWCQKVFIITNGRLKLLRFKKIHDKETRQDEYMPQVTRFNNYCEVLIENQVTVYIIVGTQSTVSSDCLRIKTS